MGGRSKNTCDQFGTKRRVKVKLRGTKLRGKGIVGKGIWVQGIPFGIGIRFQFQIPSHPNNCN